MPAPTCTSRRRSPFFFGLVAFALLLAGCSNPGKVKDYSEQTKANFLDACKAANEGEGEGNLSESDVVTKCGCWYGELEKSVSFDTFKQDNDNIEEAIKDGTFNNEDDFKRVAPNLYTVYEENCQDIVGPTAG